MSGRARGALVAAAATLVAGLSGCAAPAATTSVTGTTLTIYVSAPSAASNTRAADVLAAEQLAFARSGGHIGSFQIRLAVLRAPKISDDARAAIQDPSAVAYLGETTPGQSADSLGIVGQQQILTVSPTDNAVELTQATPAVPGTPGIWYENLRATGRTFARVVPTSALEARALVAEAAAEHVTRLYVAREPGHYGVALAAAAAQAAQRAGVAVTVGAPTQAAFSASGADALLYAGASASAATALFDATATGRPATHLFAPSALAEDSFAARLSAPAQRALVLISPGFTAADLPRQAAAFLSAFRIASGHAPSTEAIFGYEAMSAVLAVLKEAGTSARDRATVVHDFFALRNHDSVLGTYSIDASGDTNLAPFVISRVRAGHLTPVHAAPA